MFQQQAHNSPVSPHLQQVFPLVWTSALRQACWKQPKWKMTLDTRGKDKEIKNMQNSILHFKCAFPLRMPSVMCGMSGTYYNKQKELTHMDVHRIIDTNSKGGHRL